MTKAYEALAVVGTGAKGWVRTQPQLLDRMAAKSGVYKFENVANYYKKHLSKTDCTKYPCTSSTGQFYDEFGHPDFTNDVPVMAGGVRAIYKPSAGIKGSAQDLKDANNWALKPVSEGGGGFNSSNFRLEGTTKCKIKNQHGEWIECTWHHHQDGKTLMPVPSNIHGASNASHIGGVQAKEAKIIGFFDSPTFN